MKKSLFFALALVSAAFASCTKESSVNCPNNEKTVSFCLNGNDTKAVFGEKSGNTYPVLWSDNDKQVKVSNSFSSSTPSTGTVTVSQDHKTAVFSVKLTQQETENNISVISPATACVSVSTSYKDFTLTIPSSQTPGATSVDESAMVLYGYKEAGATLPESIDMTMKHFTAYGCLSFTNLNLGTDNAITGVTIEADTDITNRFYFYPSTGKIEVNSGSKTVSLATTSYTNLWFAIAPCTVASLKFTVATTKGNYIKSVTVAKEFTPGHVVPITVDMTGVSPAAAKKFTKLTDVSNLEVGDEMIIVGLKGTDYFAMSLTQNKNNRGQVKVTVQENQITETDVIEVVKIEKGTKTDTWAFKATKTTGYLYAANSSNNYLRTMDTLDDNGSWKITMTEGKALILAQGTYTRNCLRYNTDGQFSCYAESSTSTKLFPVELYTYRPTKE